MVAAHKDLNLKLPTEASTVPRARNAVVEFAARLGASEEQLSAIRLAVSEAVSNAVVHGYDNGGGGEIQITAGFARTELWVLVADDGCGFQRPSKNPGLGWGLPLIAHAADRFEIAERGEGGTEIRMRFSVGVGAAGR